MTNEETHAELVELMVKDQPLTPEKIQTFMDMARSLGRASAFLEMNVRMALMNSNRAPAALN